MKKLLLGLWLALAPCAAFGQCTGVFPANTLCGNLGANPAPPSAFTASGTIVGPGSSTLNGLPKWGNTSGTLLSDAAGTTVAGAYTWSGAQTYSALGTFNGATAFNGNNTFATGTSNFTGTFQVGGQTFLWPAAGTTVGGLGTNQTWTGNNTFSTGTVNFTGVTQINGGVVTTILTDANTLNNCSIAASVGSSALTVNLKDNAGADPSASSPCTIGFRNPTISTGTYSLVSTTGALSITAPTGASLGTTSGVAFRVWVVAFNNSGTVVLGLFQSVTGGAAPTSIAPLPESTPQSPAAISAGSTSAGTIYAASGLTTKSFRILGYLDFSSGEALAGTWVTPPDKIQIFGPGIKKPGDVIQSIIMYSSTPTSNSTTNYAITSITQAIIPQAKPNVIHVKAWANCNNGTSSQGATGQITRGTTQIGISATSCMVGGASTVNIAWYDEVLDLPQTTSSVTYSVFAKSTSATASSLPSTNGGMTIEELMD